MPNNTDPQHDRTFAEAISSVPAVAQTFAESIEQEQNEDLTLLLSSEELLEEMSADISIGEVEGVPPLDMTKRRGPILSKHQQMQVALWIIEGYKWRQMVPTMLKLWGFHVTEGTWRYYKSFRKDLQRDAAGFLEDQYLKTGFATRAVRVRKLGRMLERLENYMDTHGLEETDEHVAGYGKSQSSVKTVKFAAQLVKQYNEGLNLMHRWTDAPERIVDKLKGQDTVAVDKETTAQFLLASNWQPNGSE